MDLQLDLAKDLVIIYGWSLSLSTLLIWVSAMIGMLANLLYNRHMYLTFYKENKLNEIAKDAFMAAEKVAKLTPMKSDDKLLFYLKQAFKAFKITFKRKPSASEVIELEAKAAALANKDKVIKLANKTILDAAKGAPNA